MAAAAAEPGAAAVPTTITAATDDEGPPQTCAVGPGPPGAPPDSTERRECGPAAEQGAPAAEEEEERRHVRPQPAAGKEDAVTDEPAPPGPAERLSADRFSPGLPVDAEAGGSVSVPPPYRGILPDPPPSAVFLHSLPAPPPASEAGLSLAEPAEPTTNETTDRAEAGRDRGYTARRPGGGGEDGLMDGAAARMDPETAHCEPASGLRDAAADDGPAGSDPGAAASVRDLSPGTEVRVCLDHVIDDALVVSFRVGPQVFSGVLMDVNKRFGPYGIPITVFPRREDCSRPPDDEPSRKQEVTGGAPPSPPPPEPWASKPPPLFQQGAPYPPPLFIRDTYNQTVPQPLPRKIRRPKRRYRCEEPTSIMNAIRLRPRAVLCDKCKGVATAGGREARRGAVDLRGEEASRRRRASDAAVSSEVKRLRNDDKRRPSSRIRVTSSSAASARRVLRGVASPASPSSSRIRLKLNPKKVLDKSPAGTRRPKDQSQTQTQNQNQNQNQTQTQTQNQNHNQTQGGSKAVTRASALQARGQKVHFTRRLSAVPAVALPPRIRLKPQRYRTDDGQAPPPSPSPSPSPPPRPSPPKPPPCVDALAVETPGEEGADQRAPPPSVDSETFDPPPGAPPPSPPRGRRRAVLSRLSRVSLPDGRLVCVGDVVWAKIYGFPWWPARLLAVTAQEARVSWFGSPTTSLLPLAQLSSFLETFQCRFDRKRRGPYRRAIAEAASAAKQLTPEVRALLTQFET